MKKSSLLVAVGAALLSCAPAHAVTGVAQALSDMRQLNAIVLGDMKANGDVEGKAWVGGNLNNNIVVGFGNHANGQSAQASSYATLTVKGSTNGGVNLSNGAGVGGGYGAVIGGDIAGDFNVNASNGTIRVGGSIAKSLNLNTNTNLSVSGNTNGFSTNTGSTVHVGGSANGNNNNIGAGSAATVTGNMSTADISGGSTLIVGGSLGNFNGSSNSVVSMGSYSGSNKVAVSSGSHVYVGSSINQAENNGDTLEVIGNIGDMQGYGHNSVTKVTGSIGGNGNGIGNAPTYVYAGGGIAGAQNANGNAANVHAGYTYNSGIAAPTTLGTPAAPAAPALAVPLSEMTSNMQALSTALYSQTNANATSSVSFFNDGRGITLNATSSGSNAVAVFNLDAASLSSYTGISYNFSDPNLVVVVNLLNTQGGTFDWNMTWNTITGAGNAYNQQVIFNFGDTSTVNLNRETWGSILAANATVSNGGGNINGSLVAKVFNQGGEVHLGTFNGFEGFLVTNDNGGGTPGSVPEPASWAMMLSGFGAIGTMIRRRRRQDLAKAA
jgi:choice-of-anchor A domain-containing protein